MADTSTRFIRLPAESISLCGESVGIQVNQEIEELLNEDVSYRIRKIAHVACQFMHHANRTNLTSNDIDKALKWATVEPVLGHTPSDTLPEFQFLNNGLYSIVDREVRLVDVAHDQPIKNIHEVTTPLQTSAQWLSVEGSLLVNDDGEPVFANGATIELRKNASEAQYSYISMLMEGVSGDSEDIRQVALHNLQYSATPANVLPFLFQYIQETLMLWKQFLPQQLVRFLRMVVAVFCNQSLFLDLYSSNTLTLLHAVIMDFTYQQPMDAAATCSHWHVRELTACAIAEIIKKCNNPLSDNQESLLSSFTQKLASHTSTPLPVLYGIISTLCYLGGKSICVSLLPVLAPMASYIQEMLLITSLPSVQQEAALRVYNIILIAAEILLTSSDSLTEELSQQFTVFQQVLAPESVGVGSDNTTPSIDVLLHDCNINSLLYECLVELFGERLLLMLESRKKWDKNSTTITDSKKENSISNEVGGISTRTQAYIDESFRRHQMREGFVSLHHMVSSQRLVTMKKPLMAAPSVNCHPFSIRMYRLPIMHNVLEFSSSRSSPARSQYKQKQAGTSASGTGPAATGNRIRKGKLKGRRRHYMNLNYFCNSSVGWWWI